MGKRDYRKGHRRWSCGDQILEKDQYNSTPGMPTDLYLLQQIRSQHQNLRVCSKALYCPQVSNPFLEVFRRRHDLEDVEGSP